MPPPPPPSKSYLWNFTDSDLDDSDDDDHHRHSSRTTTSPPSLANTSIVSSSTSSNSLTSTGSGNDRVFSYARDESMETVESFATALTSDPTTAAAATAVVEKDEALSAAVVVTPAAKTAISNNNKGLSYERCRSLTFKEEFRCSPSEVAIPNIPSSSKNVKNNSNKNNKNAAAKTTEPTPVPVADVSFEEEEKSSEHSDDDSDDEGTPLQQQQRKGQSSKNKKGKNKKKKNKNNKKKKRKNSYSQPSTQQLLLHQPMEKITRRNVCFGTVTVLEFERCLGWDAVPLDGGWPLGLSFNLQQRSDPIALEDYETSKQARLLERWREIHSAASTPEEPSTVLESRQWDHLRGSKNPLFGTVYEKERMNLLLDASSSHDGQHSGAHSTSPTVHSSLTSSHAPDRRHAKYSKHKNDHHHHSNHHNSNNHHHNNHHQANVERFNEVYTHLEVHHVRHQIEQIRSSRTGEGAVGCTCRRLVVYIPPPDSGKKAQHRRLSQQKLKEELRKRGLLSMATEKKMTREQMELFLHDVVEKEPCCSSNTDCPCFKNGLGCQDDACSCWFSSHQAPTGGKHHADGTNNNNSKTTNCQPETIRERCGNPNGMYIVDVDGIYAFRKQFLYCQEVAKQQKHLTQSPTENLDRQQTSFMAQVIPV